MKFGITTFANDLYQERQFELLNYSSNLKLFDYMSFITEKGLKTTDFYKNNKYNKRFP
jgi:hypothetical protein